MVPDRPSRLRLLLFAFGDFAFNLYWQSVMLFLLFYYTDALGISIGIAATTYMVASIWDGCANFAAGALLDRLGHRVRYGALLAAGSVPLGLTFILAYMPPAAAGEWMVASIFAAHLLFRTAYAGVNVPYLAMTARISSDDRDRAFVAGLRMLFGTSAAVTVALATVPLGSWLSGGRVADAYFAAAVVFACVGAVILVVVGATYRDQSGPHRPPAQSLAAALLSLARNRGFVTLNAAMMAMVVANTALNKSTLYYFKYVLGDATAGQLALGAIGLVGAIAIPLWMLIARVTGLRALWMIAAGLGMAGLALFVVFRFDQPRTMQAFLVGMQVASIGLNFVFWAMLPNTIEYGEDATGVHVEGTVFGLAALLQRIAIGLATAILGWSFDSVGYVANARQSAATLAGMRATIAIVPLTFLALSCVAMILN
ncbi:MFS transporter, partial [Sphingomonas sp.]|uniref:MFS transporter n=1 Tax=Sphingomonas sp. TaxID=28214 RepID=UPI0025E35388